jgi:hypothetical protein
MKSKSPKFARMRSEMETEMDSWFHLFKRVSVDRYRFDGVFDVCLNTGRIVFLDGRGSVTYSQGVIEKLVQEAML